MIVQIRVGDSLLIYDVQSLQELRDRAAAHFAGVLSPSTRLTFFYTLPTPSMDHEIGVITDEDFINSLDVWDKIIRPVQLARRHALLPLYVAQVEDVTKTQAAVVEPVQAQGEVQLPARKAAARKSVPSHDEASDGLRNATIEPAPLPASRSAETTSTPASYVDTYRNHEVAVSLLGTFKEKSIPERPTLRATLRGGQASCRVRFDPYCFPNAEELKRSVADELLRRLSSEERSTILAGVQNGETKFLLYATLPGAPADVDLEDNSDVAFIADKVKAFGDDFSVQLIAEWVAGEEIPDADFQGEEVRHIQTDLVEVVLPPRAALSVNLAHTPKREKHEIKSIPLDEEGGDNAGTDAAQPSSQ